MSNQSIVTDELVDSTVERILARDGIPIVNQDSMAVDVDIEGRSAQFFISGLELRHNSADLKTLVRAKLTRCAFKFDLPSVASGIIPCTWAMHRAPDRATSQESESDRIARVTRSMCK